MSDCQGACAIVLSSFNYDKPINSIVKAKTTSDLKCLVLTNNDGSLQLVVNGEWVKKPSHVLTTVKDFEWHESGNEAKYKKLAVVTEEGVCFYSVDLQMNRNECLQEETSLPSLKCTHKILFEDLQNLIKSKNWTAEETCGNLKPSVRLLNYEDNTCVLLVNGCVASFQVSSNCVTLKSIFKVNCQANGNFNFIQVVGFHLFSLVTSVGILYIYNIANGNLLTEINVHEHLGRYLQNISLTLDDKTVFSVSQSGHDLVLIDSCHNAYYINMKSIVKPVNAFSSIANDNDSIDSLESSLFSPSNKLDSTSLSETMSYSSDIHHEPSKHTYAALKSRKDASLCPVWVSSMRKQKCQLSGLDKSSNTENSTYNRSSNPSTCKTLVIPPVNAYRGIKLSSTTVTLWEKESNSDFGSLLVINLETGEIDLRMKFKEDTHVILNNKCGLPHLLLTRNQILAFSYSMAQEEIVSKFMLYESAAAADHLARINSWDCISMPLNVLELGLKNYQLDAISFFLNSQDDDMSTLSKVTEMDLEHLKTIMTLLSTTIKESLEDLGSRNFAQQLLHISIDYFNRVLRRTVTVAHLDASTSNKEFAPVGTKVGQLAMEYLIELRSYLKDFPTFNSPVTEKNIEDDSAIFRQQLEELPTILHSWDKWAQLEFKDVIRDSVWNRCLPIAQAYCLHKKLWDESNAPIFHVCSEVVLDYVIELLNDANLDHAVTVLKNFGLDSDAKLKEILYMTANRRLRRLLEDDLKARQILSKNEDNTMQFFHNVESIYPCQSFTKAQMQNSSCSNNGHLLKQIFSAFQTSECDEVEMATPIPFGEIEISEFDNWENLNYCCLTLDWTKTWNEGTWQKIIIEGLLAKQELRWPELISQKLAWIYLLQHNCWNQLSSLVRQKYSGHDESTASTLVCPFSSEMINDIEIHAAPYTANLLLSELTRHGIVSFKELDESSVRCVIKRFGQIGAKESLSDILSLPSASLTLEEFHIKVINLCVKYSLPHVLLYYSDEFNITNELIKRNISNFDLSWMKMLVQFRNWCHLPTDCDMVFQASLSNAENKFQHSYNSVEAIMQAGHAVIGIATLLYGPCSLKMAIGSPEISKGSPWKISEEVLMSCLDSEPVLKSSLVSLVTKHDHILPLQDITVYELLQDSVPFDVSQLFAWQTTNTLGSSDVSADMPYFAQPDLVKQYGYLQDLDFTFYVKQGRPTFAYAKFVACCIQESNTVLPRRIRDACNQAHLIAIQHFHSLTISSACIAFMEMLNWNTQGLRIDLEVSQTVLHHRNRQIQEVLTGQKKENKEKEIQDEIAILLRKAICGQKTALLELLAAIEEAILDKTRTAAKRTSVEVCCRWNVVLMYCRRYSLPYSTTFLKQCVHSNDWIMFVFFAEIHKYPKSQILQLVSEYENKQMMAHFVNAFNQLRYINLKSSSKVETRSKPRDMRAELYSKIGVNSSRKDELKKDIPEKKNAEIASDEESRASTAGSSDDLTDNSASSLLSLEASFDIFAKEIPTDLLGVILYCHQKSNPWLELLNCAIVLKNPVLAIMAACYENAMVLECLCIWLLTTLKCETFERMSQSFTGVIVFNLETFQNVIIEALQMKQLPILTEGFYFFQPDSPLYSLLRFLRDFLLNKSYSLSINFFKEFQSEIRNVHENSVGIGNKQWLEEVSVLIINECLLNISSSYERMQFLSVLNEQGIADTLQNTSSLPSYSLLYRVEKLLASTNVKFNLACLLKASNHPAHIEECRMILHSLLKNKLFTCAYTFVEITDLPKSMVIISQMHEELSLQQHFKEGDNVRTKFAIWKHCLNVFIENGISEDVMFKFCKDYGMQIAKPSEKYFVLSLAWLIANSTPMMLGELECEDEFEKEMWIARISAELESENNPEDINETVNELDFIEKKIFNTKPFQQTTSDSLILAANLQTRNIFPLIDDLEKLALEKIIGQELDKGNIGIAYRLSILFNEKCLSLSIILTCMKLAEGVMALHLIDVDMRLLLERGSVLRPRKLSSRSFNLSFERNSSSFGSYGSTPNSASNVTSKGGQVLTLTVPKMYVQNDVLIAMEKLLDHCEFGAMYCSKIITIYKIADVLKMNYLDIVRNWNDINLLKVLLQSEDVERYMLAKDYIVSNNMDDTIIAEFLCEHILCAIQMFTENTTDDDQCLRGSRDLLFRPNDTLATFNQLARLCKDPSILGCKLLEITETKCLENVGLSLEVELCKCAHSCFTIACHVEGITRSLHKARRLSYELTKASEFQLMISLLTGIARFSEMTYIFDILREHHQFELLFRKGMEKIPDLKLALLDYLKRFYPADTETFTMVALHFSMYREIAEMLENSAKQQIANLKTSSENPGRQRETLEIILQYMADAAESYAKAECFQHAIFCSKQAELVALQIFMQPTSIIILNLDPSQVSDFIANHSNVSEAFIVAEAYNQHQSWARALYNNFVLKNASNYLKDFMTTIRVIPPMIEEIARRFKKEPSKTSKMISNMKQLLELIDDVQLKYELADELEFNDIAMDMLRGENAYFLQDVLHI